LQRANLIAITKTKAIPKEIMPFVEFKASLKKRELSPDQVVVIILIESTSCYVPVFIDDDTTIDAIREELAAQEAELYTASERAIEEYLAMRGKGGE